MDFTYNEKTVMSSGGFIPSTNDTPLDARGRVNLYSEIKDIPNPYVGMEIRVLQDETNEGKMTKYKVTKLLPNEFGVPNSYIDTDTLEKISESLSDEDLVFDGICEDELGVITPQLKTDYNLTTTDKTIVGAINELKEALANIKIGDNGEAVNLPFNSIDKGLASSNIDFSEIKNGNYCYIVRGTIGYDIPDGNLPLNNDMVHITKSNTAMTIITLSGGIYTYNGGTNGTDYISCTKDNFMTYSVASETYQLKNDGKLITTDKTVVGAINELKNALDSGVNGVSTILTVSPTYEELDTLPEGSKVYILNGLGYNGDPVHINKSSDTITLIGIDGAINKYQKVGSSWSNYSTENWATQKYVDTAIANAKLGGESGSVDLSEYQKITDSSLTTTNKTIVGAINEINGNTNYVRDVLGNGDELLTNNKTNVVAAINEVFQSGVNVKQNLVDALIAKNIDCSTSNSFDELISMINEIRYSPFVDWAKANTWLVTGTCTAMPATSYYLTAEAYKSKIYCIGGYGTTTATRVYDTKTNSWATLANVPTGIYGHGSTIIGDKIYCIGGYNKIAKNQVYNISNNKWSTLADMTTARMYHSTDAVGTNIYCIGGNGSTTYLKTNECYDTITNTWSSKATMTVAKYGHGSAVIGTNIYCIGGYTGSFVKTNYCYDTTTNTWTTKTAVTAVRRYISCVTVDDKIYAMCGQSASSTYQKTNYCYDPITDTWTTMTACVGTASYGKGAAAVNGMIFLFGGYSGSALKTVECYIV